MEQYLTDFFNWWWTWEDLDYLWKKTNYLFCLSKKVINVYQRDEFFVESWEWGLYVSMMFEYLVHTDRYGVLKNKEKSFCQIARILNKIPLGDTPFIIK